MSSNPIAATIQDYQAKTGWEELPSNEKTLVPENAAAKHAAAFLFPPLHGAVNVFICTGHFFPPTTEGNPKKNKRENWGGKDPGTCLTEKGKGFKVVSQNRG